MDNQPEIKKCPNCEMMSVRGQKIGSNEGAALAFSVLLPTLLVVGMNLDGASMPWWANILLYLIITPPSLLIFAHYKSKSIRPDIKLEKREEVKEDADRREGEKLSTILFFALIAFLVFGAMVFSSKAPVVSFSMLGLIITLTIFVIIKEAVYKKKFKEQIEAEIEQEVESIQACPNCDIFYRNGFKDGREKSLAVGIGLWLFLTVGLILGAKKELSHLSVAVLYYATIVPAGLIYAFTRKQAKGVTRKQKIIFLSQVTGAIILGIALAYLSSRL